MTEPAYACTLTDTELAARRREWKELGRSALVRAETSPNWRLLVYRGGEETVRVLRSLIEAERSCCPFLDFKVEARDGEVRVEVGFPPESSSMMELGSTRPPGGR